MTPASGKQAREAELVAERAGGGDGGEAAAEGHNRTQGEVGRQARHQAVGAQHQHVLREPGGDRRGGDVEHGGRRRARHLQGVGKGGRDAEVFGERDGESVERRGEGMAG